MTQSILNTLLEDLKETGEFVRVFLIGGVKIEGYILDFCEDGIIVSDNTAIDSMSQKDPANFIFYHAISTIKTM